MRDPESALSWSLASRETGEPLDDDIRIKIAGLAYGDYETTARLISDSTLSAAEKQQMRETARTTWNQQKAAAGEWDQIIPKTGGQP